MKNLFFLCLILLPSKLQSQYFDRNWIFINLFADTAPLEAPFPANLIQFDSTFPRISLLLSPFPARAYQTTISDKDGQLLFFSNAHQVFNMDGSLIINGDTLDNNPLVFACNEPTFGRSDYVNSYLLPSPHSTKEFLLFQIQQTGANCFAHWSNLIMSKISITNNSANGKVIDKGKLLFSSDSKSNIARLAATKHANGRDWWLSVVDLNLSTGKPEFNSCLITPDTIQVINKQIMEGYKPIEFWHGPWTRLFSPDGQWCIGSDIPTGQISLHKFDRCNGLYEPLIKLDYPIPPTGYYDGSIAVSPNSQYLYVSNTYHVFQYDLTAADIESTKDTVATWNGFSVPQEGPAGFNDMRPAPDGKIYITTPTNYMHYIAQPNKKGKACTVVQRGIKLPVATKLAWQHPYPNYWTGAIDNSPCDTLGINNFPKADFWWFQDSTLTVEFSDNSFYEPANWSWDFGDGGMSQDTSPYHTFPKAGVYKVCLSVSNQNGSDTVCKEVSVGTSSYLPIVPDDKHSVQVFPNPANDFIQLVYDLKDDAQFSIYDLTGKLILDREIFKKDQHLRISIKNFSEGIYFWTLSDPVGRIQSTGKILVLK